jgi:hypothetical protein
MPAILEQKDLLFGAFWYHVVSCTDQSSYGRSTAIYPTHLYGQGSDGLNH